MREIEQLNLQIDKLKRRLLDSKSEKVDRKIGQLETRLEFQIPEEGAFEQKRPAAIIPPQQSVRKPVPEYPRVEVEEEWCSRNYPTFVAGKSASGE